MHKPIFWFIVAAFLCSCHSTFHDEDLSAVQVPDVEISPVDSALELISNGQLMYNDEPFSGTLLAYYSFGELKSSSQYIDGLRHGSYVGYYEDRFKRFVRYYKNGEKHSLHRG